MKYLLSIAVLALMLTLYIGLGVPQIAKAGGVFIGAGIGLAMRGLIKNLNLIGVARPFIGGSIATVVFTELTPVLTALVIAGRVGGAMTAQIGTMQVSEQIDALEMMAIDKNRYLSMPRVPST